MSMIVDFTEAHCHYDLDFENFLQYCKFNRLSINAALKVQKKILISSLYINCLEYFMVLLSFHMEVTEVTIQNNLAVKSHSSGLNLNAVYKQ